MSCPSSNSPLSSRQIDDLEYASQKEVALYGLGITAIIIAVAFLYRQVWLGIYDLIRFFRPPSITVPGCRRIGKPGDRNLSKEYTEETASDTKSPWRIAALFDYPIKSCYPVEVQESTIAPSGFEYDRQFCFASWCEPTPAAGVEFKIDASPKETPKKGSEQYWPTVRHWGFLTQRKQPFLTRVKVEIWVPDLASKGYSADAEYVKSEGCLVVSFPFAPDSWWRGLAAKLSIELAEPIWTFRVPFNPTAEQIREKKYPYEKVRIWRDEPAALDMTKEIPVNMLEMLKYCLGIPSLSDKHQIKLTCS